MVITINIFIKKNDSGFTIAVNPPNYCKLSERLKQLVGNLILKVYLTMFSPAL